MQYCIAAFSGTNSNVSTGIGVCVPMGCSSSEVTDNLSGAWVGFGQDVGIDVTCEPELEESMLPTFAFITFVILIAILLCSTVYEATSKQPTNNLATAFSLLRNSKTLFNFSDDRRNLKCVDGLRTLTMLWLVTYHTFRSYEYYTPSKVNPEAVQAWQQSFRYSFIHYAPLAVDTFLLLCGLLLAYKFMQDRERKRRFNYLYYCWHRFIRLTPVLASAVVFYVLVFRYEINSKT